MDSRLQLPESIVTTNKLNAVHWTPALEWLIVQRRPQDGPGDDETVALATRRTAKSTGYILIRVVVSLTVCTIAVKHGQDRGRSPAFARDMMKQRRKLDCTGRH